MNRRRDIGVRAILRCPRCGHEYETTVSAGTGIKPGQVIEQDHFPGMCIDAYDDHHLVLDTRSVLEVDQEELDG